MEFPASRNDRQCIPGSNPIPDLLSETAFIPFRRCRVVSEDDLAIAADSSKNDEIGTFDSMICDEVNDNMTMGSSASFPMKLYAMLEDAESNGFQHTVSWCFDDKAFKVHDTKEFFDFVLPQYFAQTRYKSFLRQLNIYGFTRVPRGPHKGICFHELFVRGKPELCASMQRKTIKDCSDEGPDDKFLTAHESRATGTASNNGMLFLDSGTPLGESGMIPDSSGQMGSGVVDDFASVFCKNDMASLCGSSPHSAFDDCVAGDVSSNASSTGKFPEDSILEVLLEEEAAPPQRAEMNSRRDSFPWRLYDLLDAVEDSGLSHIISWELDGRALKIHRPKDFVSTILPVSFAQCNKLESFQRQLNLYGFRRITRGPNKGMYTHKYLVRGSRGLCRLITRPK